MIRPQEPSGRSLEEHEPVSCPRETTCQAAQCSGTRCCALVRRAGTADGSSAQEALSAFCDASWRPVYGFVRAQGYRAADAEDLTQAYFARFLEKGYMEDVRSWRGCLRPFLRVSVRHFLSNERDRERAAKRGGGRPLVSLDAGDPESFGPIARDWGVGRSAVRVALHRLRRRLAVLLREETGPRRLGAATPVRAA